MPVDVVHLELGPHCLVNFPGAAAVVAEVVSTTADLEIGNAMILATLSGSDPKAAATVLRQMRSVHEQEKAVLKVAEDRICKAQYNVLRAAYEAGVAHRRRRNDFAHKVWARSNELPGGIFQLDVTEYSSRLISLLAKSPSEQDDSIDFNISVEDEDIYRPEKFAEVRAEARHTRTIMLFTLQYMLAVKRKTPGSVEEADTILKLLREIPLYADHYDRIARDKPRSRTRKQPV